MGVSIDIVKIPKERLLHELMGFPEIEDSKKLGAIISEFGETHGGMLILLEDEYHENGCMMSEMAEAISKIFCINDHSAVWDCINDLSEEMVSGEEAENIIDLYDIKQAVDEETERKEKTRKNWVEIMGEIEAPRIKGSILKGFIISAYEVGFLREDDKEDNHEEKFINIWKMIEFGKRLQDVPEELKW